MNVGMSVAAQAPSTSEELVRALIAISKSPKPFEEALVSLEKRRAEVNAAEGEAKTAIEAANNSLAMLKTGEEKHNAKASALDARQKALDALDAKLALRLTNVAADETRLKVLDNDIKTRLLDVARKEQEIARKEADLEIYATKLKAEKAEAEERSAALAEKVRLASQAFAA
jgi:uncharacterized protein (DUF3084 family)